MWTLESLDARARDRAGFLIIQELLNLASFGCGRLSSHTCDGDCARRVGESDGVKHRFSFSQSNGQRAVESVAGRGRVDRLHFETGNKLLQLASGDIRAARAERDDDGFDSLAEQRI